MTRKKVVAVGVDMVEVGVVVVCVETCFEVVAGRVSGWVAPSFEDGGLRRADVRCRGRVFAIPGSRRCVVRDSDWQCWVVYLDGWCFLEYAMLCHLLLFAAVFANESASKLYGDSR